MAKTLIINAHRKSDGAAIEIEADLDALLPEQTTEKIASGSLFWFASYPAGAGSQEITWDADDLEIDSVALAERA